MTTPERRPSPIVTALLVALVVGGWLAAVLLLYYIAPRAKRGWDGVEWPWLTAQLLELGDPFGPLLLPLTAGVSLLLGGAVYTSRHHVRSRGMRWLGLLAAASLPVLTAAVIGLTLLMPAFLYFMQTAD